MAKKPSVSILVAAYNEEKYIGRCIRSLLNQSLERSQYEIIVVNDASSDRTNYALQVFGTEVHVIENDKQLGLPGSLNRGIKAAKGEFLVRLDGDDYVSREYLNFLQMFLSLNPNMDAVACDYLVVDDDENVLARKDCMVDPVGCGIMFRLKQLIEIGMYDDQFLLHEDADLRMRFLRKYQIHRLALPLYRYRRHSDNMTNNTAAMEKFRESLLRKHGEYRI